MIKCDEEGKNAKDALYRLDGSVKHEFQSMGRTRLILKHLM